MIGASTARGRCRKPLPDHHRHRGQPKAGVSEHEAAKITSYANAFQARGEQVPFFGESAWLRTGVASRRGLMASVTATRI